MSSARASVAPQSQEDRLQRIETLLVRIAQQVNIPASEVSQILSVQTPSHASPTQLRSSKPAALASPRASSSFAASPTSNGVTVRVRHALGDAPRPGQTEGERTRFGFLLKNRQPPKPPQPLHLNLERAVLRAAEAATPSSSLDLSSLSQHNANNNGVSLYAAAVAAAANPSHASPSPQLPGSNGGSPFLSPPALYRPPDAASMSPRTLDEARHIRMLKRREAQQQQPQQQHQNEEQSEAAPAPLAGANGGAALRDGATHKRFAAGQEVTVDTVTPEDCDDDMPLSGATTPRPQVGSVG